MALLGRNAVIPDFAMRVLKLIPPAAFAALIAPSLTHAPGEFDPTSDRLIAGVVAGLIAWRTKNVLATIAAGMGALWLLQALG